MGYFRALSRLFRDDFPSCVSWCRVGGVLQNGANICCFRYSKLDITAVNTHGILIEWKGKDETLKPYLFMGHQDVVPVLAATESRWTYPPYSAHYDGRFIWGRGGSDCKNVVIGVLEAFETLLAKGYTPERTMMAGFGFDEEISGWHGALYISKHIEETKGKDSLELIIDEGGLGIKEMYGAMFVLPGLGEKGKYSPNHLYSPY